MKVAEYKALMKYHQPSSSGGSIMDTSVCQMESSNHQMDADYNILGKTDGSIADFEGIL